LRFLPLRQSLFNIFHPVVSEVTGEIVGPFETAVFAGEPVIRGGAQGVDYLFKLLVGLYQR
jgi:hypothetical protein